MLGLSFAGEPLWALSATLIVEMRVARLATATNWLGRERKVEVATSLPGAGEWRSIRRSALPDFLAGSSGMTAMTAVWRCRRRSRTHETSLSTAKAIRTRPVAALAR